MVFMTGFAYCSPLSVAKLTLTSNGVFIGIIGWFSMQDFMKLPDSEFKAGFNNWSERAYRVTSISGEQGQSLYSLEGYARPLLRHELLRVEAVMPPPRRRVVGKRSAL